MLDFILAPLQFGSRFTCFFSCTWFHRYCPSWTTSYSSSSTLCLWLQRRLYQWALFAAAGGAEGGGEELQHYCRSSAPAHKLIMKSPPSSGSRPPRLMGPVTSSSHELQLVNPSPQFVYDPHAEVLILVFLSLVLLVRLAKELVKLLRYLLLLTREFVARAQEPIIIPPHDAQLQAVAESTISELMGEYWIVSMIDFIAVSKKIVIWSTASWFGLYKNVAWCRPRNGCPHVSV